MLRVKGKNTMQQGLLGTALTEMDVFRACMRQFGRMGGLRKTEAQTAARKINARKAIAGRRAKRNRA